MNTQMNKQMVSDIVVALLTGSDVDGETMQYIIERVGMKEQMLKQLVVNADDADLKIAIENRQQECPIYQQVFNAVLERTPQIDADKLAEKIMDDVIDNIDVSDLEDYHLTMSGREVEVDSISLDSKKINRHIVEAIKEYIEELKEVDV